MRWNVSDYNRHAGHVSQMGVAVVDLLNPQRQENILDIGCGDGTLSEIIKQRGARVCGIDGSPEMVQAARKRGVAASVADAQQLEFINEFDAVFSNAALHWMKKPDDVICGVFRALKPGGRFCAEFGATQGNVGTITTAIAAAMKTRGLDYAAYSPWYFPQEDEYRQKLENAGFHIVCLSVFDRPTRLPTDVLGWLKVFAQPFLKDITDPESFLHEVVGEATEKMEKEDDMWIADYVRCRFLAVKQSSFLNKDDCV